jgi:hypothetical protein
MTDVFSPSEWPPVHSGGSDNNRGVIGLYFGIISGSAVAGIAAGVALFLIWRRGRARSKLNPRGLSEDFTSTDNSYVEGNWHREQLREFAHRHRKPEKEVGSIPTFRGEDIDELL